MSTSLPTPLRALLGLAALAVEEARKIPDTLPGTMTAVPVEMISAAMQASLKFQQQIAVLASKGDEVLNQLRGAPEEPPAWATFDDDDVPADTRPVAAFDRVTEAGPENSWSQDSGWQDAEPAAGGFADTGSDLAGSGDNGPQQADADQPDSDTLASSQPAGEVDIEALRVQTALSDSASTVRALAKKAPTKKAPTKKAAAKTAPAKKAAARDTSGTKAGAGSAPKGATGDASADAAAASSALPSQPGEPISGPATPSVSIGPAVPPPVDGPAAPEPPAGPAVPTDT